ncbi:RluA family pseudouridine synthase [Bacillus sp. FSL K6-3431]|uniref:RluA family pseudouridine synthase n=1 Tax=Bacillus sp. FSL K6-3431 TaxID=2921500 RepID=UPI0030F9923E
MGKYSLTWTIDDRSMTKDIKSYLAEAGISRRALTDIKFAGGTIKVNGLEKNVRYKLQMLDKLEVVFPPEEPSVHLQGERIDLSIIYEDRDIMIVNKQAAMNSIPSQQHPMGSLANAIIYYYQQKDIAAAVHIVTRLDRNTSGLVLIAKHRHAHHLFSLMQREHAIIRTYESFVTGQLKKKSGIIDAPIGRKLDSIIEREVRADGKRAVTSYRLVHQYNDFAHLKLQLETGRTHQIRVHMNYIGYPMLGDNLYGGDSEIISRQALHCSKLQFIHPLTKKEMILTADLPLDMQKLIVK